MAHLMRAGALCHHRSALSKRSFGYRFLATKTYDPLRILFCGADEFSIASLKALHEEHVKRPDRISSIDVVCRPGKRVGRGLKTIREGTLSTFKDQYAWNYAHSIIWSIVPIKAVATELSLPIHEIDTFKGWAVDYSPRRLGRLAY
jgi:methionyl-tRNA formyltransferase